MGQLRSTNAGREEDSALIERLADLLSGRSVIVGIGNRDRGDDGFGPAVIDALQGHMPNALIDAGTTPENYLGSIAKLCPDTVLVVDAADVGSEPGRLTLCGVGDLGGGCGSSHAPSLALFAEYLQATVSARTAFLVAQPAWLSSAGESAVPPLPAATASPTALSPAVRYAVERAYAMITAALASSA